MAVLIEGISVVIRKETVTQKYPGGLEAFAKACPNNTLCVDEDLIRVGFMAPADTKQFVEELETHGITYRDDGQAKDLVVVDQQRGPAVPCDWTEFGRVRLHGDRDKRVMAARLVGSQSRDPLPAGAMKTPSRRTSGLSNPKR